jgi:hypothetical protein
MTNEFALLRRAGRRTGGDVRSAVVSASEVLLVAKILPGRLCSGVAYFREDFLGELERLPAAKQRRIFVLKLAGALTSCILGTVYDIRRGKAELRLQKGTNLGAATRLVLAEVLLRFGRRIFLRLLADSDRELTEPEDKAQIRYLVELLGGGSEGEQTAAEPALEIVENLKKYLMTGER